MQPNDPVQRRRAVARTEHAAVRRLSIRLKECQIRTEVFHRGDSVSVHLYPYRMGVQPLGSTPKEMQAMIDRDMARWSEVIRAANIKLD